MSNMYLDILHGKLFSLFVSNHRYRQMILYKEQTVA